MTVPKCEANEPEAYKKCPMGCNWCLPCPDCKATPGMIQDTCNRCQECQKIKEAQREAQRVTEGVA